MTDSLTMQGWRNTTTALLVQRLPFQTFETALPLVDSYLATVGGWNPTDPAMPSGVGLPQNGASPEQAAEEIRDQNYARVYRVDAEIPLVVRTEVVVNIPPNQLADTVMELIRGRIEDLVREQLSKTDLRYVSVGTHSGSVNMGAQTTQQERLEYAATLTGVGGVGLGLARREFSVDSTWNISRIYTEQGKSIAIFVEKYTDDSYQSLDSNQQQYHMLTMDPLSYELETGLKLNKE